MMDRQLMNFTRTEDDRLIRDNVRRLLATRAPTNHADHGALWSQLADLGVLGAVLPDEIGGTGGSFRTLAIIMAEAGRALAGEPMLACAAVAARIIEQCVDAAIRLPLLQRVLDGTWICVLAHDSGPDPFQTPRVTASVSLNGVCLRGVARSVRHAQLADAFLVTARMHDSDELSVVLLPKSAAGMRINEYRLIDGSIAASVELEECRLPPENVLRFSTGARRVIHDALEWNIGGLIAETAGIVAALNAATFSYLSTRKQFGTPLGTFQALRHRAADMHIAAAEIASMTDCVVDALEAPPGVNRSAAIAAAKVRVDDAARLVGHEAIQMHGGMGVSEELAISHYARRLAAIRAELGSADTHRIRFAQLGGRDERGMEPREGAEVSALRNEVREFLKAQLPDDLRRAVTLGLKLEKADQQRWYRLLAARGWLAGWWPKEHGGQGWSAAQRLAFIQELALGHAPSTHSQGVNLIGPVIYTFGSERQKREHLPAILASEKSWCQGFSEPNAGSDLASLKTAAIRGDEGYVVTGTKMWTSEAHLADMLYCLVRTSSHGKPQEGISMLLIDLRTPGITVRPIVTLDGLHRTNQLFLDAVRVPASNLVGVEGQGWTMAKFLLENERLSIADVGAKLQLLDRLRAQLDAAAAEAQIHSSIVELWRVRIAELDIQLLSLRKLEQRMVAEICAGQSSGVLPFILKIRGTEILQALTELEAQMHGAWTGAYDPADVSRAADHAFTAVQLASLATHRYLYSRCWSIFGGANEIQRNIIAKAALGF
jgi:alkylation response protein AidB-like acyl-CoA dehydrogenase